MAAGSATVLSGARRMRQGRPRHAALGAVLVALAVAFVTSMAGRELVRIRSLASEVQDTVLPEIMARQQRAIWIESLRSAADVVLYAPDPATRQRALAKAEQLAANVTHIDLASRAALDTAWDSIRLAAGKSDAAERIEHKIQAILREADGLIADMSAKLGSIVDDSGAAIARMVEEASGMRAQPPFAREALDEVMAINATSHDLVASLDRGRIILSSALALESPELAAAESDFVAIGTQLRARVATLGGSAGDEVLPAMIERFGRLAALFEHQRHKLALLHEAVAASASAKRRLGVVRDSLAADAAAAADAGIAAIAASAGRIKVAAAAMLAILIAAAVVALARSRQSAAAGAAGGAVATQDDELPVPPAAAVRATAATLEDLIKAQDNLEHWRRTLVAKLTGAVGSVLQRAAAHAAPADLRPSGPDEQAAGPDAASRDACLPAELAPCLARVVALIEDVAAQTGLAGLKAALHGVWLMAGASADPDQDRAAQERRADRPFSPAEVLAAAAAAADAVTEAIGATISQVNALAQRADRGLADATGEVMQMVAQLADQLVAIRNGDGLRRSAVSG